MKWLALDTTGDTCSVALNIDGQRHQHLEREGRQHSRRLPQMVAALLQEAGVSITALDGLLCCVGPGGFAGVRVGVAYAKGLAFGLNVPIAPVSSLALLARGAVRRHRAQRVLTAIDARMEEVYVAEYVRHPDGTLSCAQERVCAPDTVCFETHIKDGPCVASGNGWRRYGVALRTTCGASPLLVEENAVPEAIDAFDLIASAASNAFMTATMIRPSYLRNQVAQTLKERFGR